MIFFRSVETAKRSQVKLAKFQRIPRSPFLGKNDSASDNGCSELFKEPGDKMTCLL